MATTFHKSSMPRHMWQISCASLGEAYSLDIIHKCDLSDLRASGEGRWMLPYPRIALGSHSTRYMASRWTVPEIRATWTQNLSSLVPHMWPTLTLSFLSSFLYLYFSSATNFCTIILNICVPLPPFCWKLFEIWDHVFTRLLLCSFVIGPSLYLQWQLTHESFIYWLKKQLLRGSEAKYFAMY